MQVSFYTLITYLATSLGTITVAAHQVRTVKFLIDFMDLSQVLACLRYNLSVNLVTNSFRLQSILQASLYEFQKLDDTMLILLFPFTYANEVQNQHIMYQCHEECIIWSHLNIQL